MKRLCLILVKILFFYSVSVVYRLGYCLVILDYGSFWGNIIVKLIVMFFLLFVIMVVFRGATNDLIYQIERKFPDPEPNGEDNTNSKDPEMY